jgi:2-methylcitrate dehydratase
VPQTNRENQMTETRTEVQRLAEFAAQAKLEDLSPEALEQLKIRVLDTVGVAIGALDAPPMVAIRALIEELGGKPACTLLGGGRTSPELAAFFTSALSRYLDFMDAYIAPGETNHPSDNFGAVLAAAESAGASGAELLTALAVAYQVHTRLSDVAPVRARGFDHTTQGNFAAAVAAARAMGLSQAQIANAAAIAGTANVALRVTRTGVLSNWKGLAYAHVSKEAIFAAHLAAHGITGPEAVFEGNKGFKESVSGPFTIDWQAENLEHVRRTIVKKHNAEIHSQSALDAAQEIHTSSAFRAEAIDYVRLRTFQVAYSIIGGGEEGDKRSVRTKEDADHSLPWMLAAVLLDGKLTPAQYTTERISAPDVQSLMQCITITPDAALSAQFPQHMPAELEVVLLDGTTLKASRKAYRGFYTDPLDWAEARAKFDALAAPFADEALRDELADIIHHLEKHRSTDLTTALARVSCTRQDTIDLHS